MTQKTARIADFHYLKILELENFTSYIDKQISNISMEPSSYKWDPDDLLIELEKIRVDQEAQYAEREMSVLAQAIEELIELRKLKKNITQ